MFWNSAQCGSLPPARESFLPSGEADGALPTCATSPMSDAKDPQDASLVDIFPRLFQAPGAAGRRSSQHAVFISGAAWQLLYNNIA